MAQSGFVKVADVGELSPGDMKSVEVGTNQILLINHEGNIYACDDVCSHAYAMLSEGDVNGDEITLGMVSEESANLECRISSAGGEGGIRTRERP